MPSADDITDTGSAGGLEYLPQVAKGTGGHGRHVTLELVRDMINQSEKKVEAKLATTEARLEARLSQLPTEAYLMGLVREARYWAIGIVIAIVGLVFVLIGYGRDQFEAGIALTTGTINHSLDAKEAAKDSAKKFEQVMELLKQRRQDEQPKQSKPQ